MSDRATLVLSRHWHRSGSEQSYVIRSLAGAASRSGPVTVVVPGTSGDTQADGAFDLVALSATPDGQWPPPFATQATVVLGDDDTHSSVFGQSLPATTRRFTLAALPLVPAASPAQPIGLHIPINPLAGSHRHNGLGFVDYILVLSGREGQHDEPPPEAAWLTAALPQARIVVVEDAMASVWQGRSLRGQVSVDTRTDLWRLMAHALVCVDTAPGALVARECVESLRFGTPIIVPDQASAAAAHARAGGGRTYSTMGDLIAHASAFADGAVRAEAVAAGRDYAEPLFGDPDAFVAAVSHLFWG